MHVDRRAIVALDVVGREAVTSRGGDACQGTQLTDPIRLARHGSVLVGICRDHDDHS